MTVTNKIAEALAAARSAYARRNPRSAAIHADAQRVMPGGNTRTVLFYEPFPLVMVRGQGGHVWDVDGHEYADFLGEYSAGLYGHSHPVIRAAIDAALNDGINLGAHNTHEVALAQAVRDRFPSMELVRFTNSGTEANVMALTAARAATTRSKIMVFENAYHGAVLSFAGGRSDTVNAPYEFIVAPYNDGSAATAAIRQQEAQLAAILVEPMLGAGGCIPGEPEFLHTLLGEADRCGALLIFDEVMTSRLSGGGLQQRIGITPHLTTLGKYIGGGMSFGAFGGRAEIMAAFDPRKPSALSHAGTFNNNVLSMRAGLAGLTQVFTTEAADALSRSGDELRERLNALCRERSASLQFTGLGSLMTAHFRAGAMRSGRDAIAGDQRLKELLFFHLLERGIYLARRAMVTLSLPLTTDDRTALVDAVTSFLDRYADMLPRGTQRMN